MTLTQLDTSVDAGTVPRERKLRIVHCFRSPVGGIFKHVRDLVEAQAAQGHEVGIVCDSSTGGELEDALFNTLHPSLALGLERVPMRRAIGPSDIGAVMRLSRRLHAIRPDILHSHGAKGGAYGRLVGTMLRRTGSPVSRLYCPHGGSIHYDRSSWGGRLFFTLERWLELSTDRLVFVSDYERRGYIEKVGRPRCPSSLVYNGLAADEFAAIEVEHDAADFLYIGMMRDLKGVDLFMHALAALRSQGREATAVAVGDGPDLERYRKLAKTLGLSRSLRFAPPEPARTAMRFGRTVVVPSRAESMPYIVLETLAANRPIIATDVGGVPEIFGTSAPLVRPGDLEDLTRHMARALVSPPMHPQARDRVEELFSRDAMVASVMRAYRSTLIADEMGEATLAPDEL